MDSEVPSLLEVLIEVGLRACIHKGECMYMYTSVAHVLCFEKINS